FGLVPVKIPGSFIGLGKPQVLFDLVTGQVAHVLPLCRLYAARPLGEVRQCGPVLQQAKQMQHVRVLVDVVLLVREDLIRPAVGPDEVALPPLELLPGRKIKLSLAAPATGRDMDPDVAVFFAGHAEDHLNTAKKTATSGSMSRPVAGAASE